MVLRPETMRMSVPKTARKSAAEAATVKERFLRQYNPLAEGFALRTFRPEDI